MKDTQIKILLKHKDVAIIPHPAETFTAYTFSHNQEIYYISKKVYNALQSLFNFYLDAELNKEPSYQEFIDERLSSYSPLPDQIKEYYGKLIIENHNKLENLCSRIHPYAPHDIPEMLHTIWYKNLSGCMAELLQFLKFSVLNGPDRDFDEFRSRVGYYHTRYFDWLDTYFLTDKMQDVYEAISVKKKISYLQAEMKKLDISTSLLPIQGGKKRKITPIDFDNLFASAEVAEQALRALKDIKDPWPVVDERNNYIGKCKGIIPLWVESIRRFPNQNFIKGNPPNIKIAGAINSKISGLNIGQSEFTKPYHSLDDDRMIISKQIINSFSTFLKRKLGK